MGLDTKFLRAIKYYERGLFRTDIKIISKIPIFSRDFTYIYYYSNFQTKRRCSILAVALTPVF